MMRATILLALALLVGCVPPARAASPSLFADGFDGSLATCAATIQTPVGPRTRLTYGAVSYGVYPAQRVAVNLTEWDNFWGFNDRIATAPVPWPGVGGASPVIRSFPRLDYLALHFRTTAGTTLLGSFSNPSLVAGPNVIMAISAKCGDFERYLPTPGCLVHRESDSAAPWSGVPTSDANLAKWKFSPNAPGSQCNLQPNSDYFVNIMLANDATDCDPALPKCAIGVVSYHN